MSGHISCPKCGTSWDPVGTEAWRRGEGEYECPKCGAVYVPAKAEDFFSGRPGSFATYGFGTLRRKPRDEPAGP